MTFIILAVFCVVIVICKVAAKYDIGTTVSHREVSTDFDLINFTPFVEYHPVETEQPFESVYDTVSFEDAHSMIDADYFKSAASMVECDDDNEIPF